MKKETIALIKQFVKERDWNKFHTPVNLAKSLVLEAAEVLELFQWSSKETSLDDMEDELADVLVYATLLCENYHLDMDEIIAKKMKKNALKYPIEKAYGNSTKYNKYEEKV